MENLIEWVVAHGGGLHDGVRLTTDPTLGSFLRADGSLEPQTTVVTCPHSLTISYLNAISCMGFSPHGPTFPSSFLEAFPPRTITTFFLSQQFLLGEKSFWSAYIETLPQLGEGDKLGTPLYFDDEDRLWLKGTNMEKGYMERETEWKEHWAKGVSKLKEEAWETDQYTWPLALWAATILSSRSFISSLLVSALPADAKETSMAKENSFPVLYPLADTVNHKPEAKISWHTGPTELGLVIEDSLAPGDILWNNYGQKSNEELLLGYGFCVPDNPCDQFALKIRVPEESSIQTDTSKPSPGPGKTLLNNTPTELSDVNFYIRSSTHLSKGYDHPLPELRPFPPHLLDIMSALVANDLERESMHATLHFNKRDSGTYNRNCFAIIAQLLQILRRKRNEITKHNTLIPTHPLTKNQQNAKIYRDSQLSILTHALKPLEARLANAITIPPSSSATNPELLTLSTALKTLSKLDRKQHKAFTRGLETALGTSHTSELREAGWEQGIWTLWVCALRILARRKETRPSSRFAVALVDWIIDAEKMYPIPLAPRYDGPILRSEDDDDNDGDEEAITELLSIVQEASKDAAPLSSSIFAAGLWDAALLRWGNSVAKEEGFAVVIDDRDEEIGEQHVLYIGR
ncbi:MAG: hypothetical protein M1836_002579 [Candelina mexicana]|nr:MAG: hypothetical protein M1836_002579 [Candelina mexicana]